MTQNIDKTQSPKLYHIPRTTLDPIDVLGSAGMHMCEFLLGHGLIADAERSVYTMRMPVTYMEMFDEAGEHIGHMKFRCTVTEAHTFYRIKMSFKLRDISVTEECVLDSDHALGDSWDMFTTGILAALGLERHGDSQYFGIEGLNTMIKHWEQQRTVRDELKRMVSA